MERLDLDWIYQQCDCTPPSRLRVCPDVELLNYERYYRQLASQAPTTTRGYQPPVRSMWVVREPLSSSHDETTDYLSWVHVDVYPPPAPTTLVEVEPLVRFVYWMATNAHYLVSMSLDSFQIANDGVVQLIDLTGFLSLDDANYFRPTDDWTDPWALGFTLNDRQARTELSMMGTDDYRRYVRFPNQRLEVQQRAMAAVRRVLARAIRTVAPQVDIDVVWSRLSNQTNVPRPVVTQPTESLGDYVSRRTELSQWCVVRGTRGLIYRPPWPPGEESLGFVGKVFWSEEEFRRELAGADVLADVDPDGSFHVLPVRADQLTPQLYQIVYPHAGTTIERGRTINLGGLLDLLNGLETMVRHGIVHGDLSVNNVMLDERGVPQMIDYGFTTRFDRFNWRFACRHDYLFYPPEVVMAEEPMYVPPVVRLERYLTSSRRYYRRWSTIVGHSSYTDGAIAVARLADRLLQLPLDQRRQWLLERFDLYSLGITLLLTSWWRQLATVIRPMIVPDFNGRSLALAKDELERFINQR